MKSEHYSEHVACQVLRSVADAVEYLHAKGITHRDIKPENILYRAPDSYDVILVDFGFATKERDMHDFLGTTPFMPPEMFANHKDGCQATTELNNLEYGMNVDTWALGVTAFLMLTGKLPFDYQLGVPEFEAIPAFTQELRHKEPAWPGPEDITLTDAALDLLTLMLTKDPSLRIDMKAVLKHAWLNTEDSISAASDKPLASAVAANALEVLDARKAKARSRWKRTANLFHVASALKGKAQGA